MDSPLGVLLLVCALPALVLALWGWLWFWVGRNYNIIIQRRKQEDDAI